MLKRLKVYGAITSGFLLILLGSGYGALDYWGTQPQVLAKAADIHFPKGTRLNELSGALESTSIVSDALTFKLWVRVFGNYSRYQAGRYRFTGKVTPRTVDQLMSKG